MVKLIIFISAFVLVIVLLFWFLYNIIFKGKKIKSFYGKLSERYNFKLEISGKRSSIPYPISKGIYRKRRVDIGTFDKSNGGDKKPHTYIKIGSASNTDFSFILQKRNRNNNQFHSREEVITGEDEFDRSFIIQSNDPVFMKKILDYTNMNKLIQASKIGYKGEMLLLGGEIMYIEPGVIRKNNDLIRVELLLHGMCDICDDIEQYTIVKQ